MRGLEVVAVINVTVISSRKKKINVSPKTTKFNANGDPDEVFK